MLCSWVLTLFLCCLMCFVFVVDRRRDCLCLFVSVRNSLRFAAQWPSLSGRRRGQWTSAADHAPHCSTVPRCRCACCGVCVGGWGVCVCVCVCACASCGVAVVAVGSVQSFAPSARLCLFRSRCRPLLSVCLAAAGRVPPAPLDERPHSQHHHHRLTRTPAADASHSLFPTRCPLAASGFTRPSPFPFGLAAASQPSRRPSLRPLSRSVPLHAARTYRRFQHRSSAAT